MPSKHLPPGHWQIFTSWLDDGAQPHGPVVHMLGKSPVLAQHRAVLTVPPELVQVASDPPNAHCPPLQVTGGGCMHDGTGHGFFFAHAAQT